MKVTDCSGFSDSLPIGRPFLASTGLQKPLTLLHRFITNAFWNVGGKIFVQMIYFALSILISRYLGAEGLGIYASILVVPAFVRLLNTLGLEGMLNKKLPELNVHDPTGSEGRALLKKVLAWRVVTTLIFASLLYGLLPAYADWAKVPEIIAYRPAIVLYFIAVTLNSMFGTLFMTLVRFRVVTIAESLNACFNLFLLVMFIMFDWGIWGILFAYILSTLAQLMFYIQLARPHISGPVKETPMEEVRSLAWTVYGINLLSIGLWTQSDIMLMNYFEVSRAGIGYYHLATSLGAMVVFALMGLGQLAQSLYSESYARDGAPGLSSTWQMTIAFCAWITAPVGVFAFCFAPEIVSGLFGTEFAPVANVFRIYVTYLLIAAILGSDLNNFALFVLHKRKTALLISFEGSVWNLILDVLWIPLYGETGAALATGSVMVYMVIRQLFAMRASVRSGALLYPLILVVLVSLTALIPGWLMFGPGIPALGFQILSFAMTFLLFTLWVKPLPPEVVDWAHTVSPKLAARVQWFVKIKKIGFL
ncbi:MAG: oligosaccharide flippase family protein [Candidatus Nitronauta litoralis]|uniref:Oligosaccharide flippase family protein n=1 Tax=Candidatus Nitronauta litoralis TaxID=2705533 RepID=A0A7T0BUH6_9BACT|nr:MAG: oligosaccharide flippase family protein [Candidatus Nitronauta litoralis]